MSEKHKRLDLKQVRALIEFEKDSLAQKRIANGEKIARRIIREIANMNCSIFNGVIKVQFRIWQRDIWDYSELTVKEILKANGLMLSPLHVYASDVLDVTDNFPLPGRWFTARIELYVEPELAPIEELFQIAEEYTSEVGNDDHSD